MRVHENSLRTVNFGIVPAMLVKKYAPSRRESTSQHSVEVGAVLMSVEETDLPLCSESRDPHRNDEVDPRLTVKLDHRDARVSHLFCPKTSRVETGNNDVEFVAQSHGQLRRQTLGSTEIQTVRDVHDTPMLAHFFTPYARRMRVSLGAANAKGPLTANSLRCTLARRFVTPDNASQ